MERLDLRSGTVIIAIFGPDGAGKSTHVDLLVAFLRKKGLKIRKAWVGSHHLLAWVLGRILVRLGYSSDHWTSVNPHLRKFVDILPIEKRLGKLRRFTLIALEFVSVLAVDLLRVRLPRLLGYNIIVERYLLTTLADLTYIFGWDFLDTIVAKLLVKLIPKDVYFVFLDADYSALAKRRGVKTEPEAYLEVQKSIYKWFAKRRGYVTIDTSNLSVHDTQAIIRQALGL